MTKLKKISQSLGGFTLVELLIVIGILGILAATLLVTLNPTEAQRRSRDTQRIKDLTTLQLAIESLINEGGNITGCLTTQNGCTTNGIATKVQTCANTNFLQMDVCRWVRQISLDPLNNTTRTAINGTGTVNAAMIYRAVITGSDYEINARLESNDNRARVTADGGNSAQWYEIGSNLNIISD